MSFGGTLPCIFQVTDRIRSFFESYGSLKGLDVVTDELDCMTLVFSHFQTGGLDSLSKA